MALKTNTVVLDTHVWIWLFNGDPQLSQKQLALIQQAISGQKVGIPAIAVWELAMQEKKGRITLSMPIHTWVKRSLEAPGTSLLDLTPEIAIESCHLPGEFHGDPADRLIVATARVHNAILLTKDQQILDYAKGKHVQVQG